MLLRIVISRNTLLICESKCGKATCAGRNLLGCLVGMLKMSSSRFLAMLHRELQGVLQGARLMVVDLQHSAEVVGNASEVAELVGFGGKP